MTKTLSITGGVVVAIVLATLLLGTPLITHASDACSCTPHTETIVSDDTNTVIGDTALEIAAHPGWSASIPGATWIWKVGATADNETVSFEQDFTVIGTVLSATLDIASDNSYEVFIDNVLVASDANVDNFKLSTQDVHDLTLDVTPGVHTLRIEVNNVGTYNTESNPAGLLYKLVVESEKCPSDNGGVTIIVCNSGSINNETTALSDTGGNVAGGSYGGDGGSGGDVDPSGDFNNGGASAGNGGDGGDAGPGGFVQTGNATSRAITVNDANSTDLDVEIPEDMNSSSIAVIIDNADCECNSINNLTRARSRTGDNTAKGSEGGDGGEGGDVVADDGDNNNGGASAGDGGNGGKGRVGGTIVTGNADSVSTTMNFLNTVIIRLRS